MVFIIIPSNDEVVRYFVDYYDLRSTFPRDGRTLEDRLLELSDYNEVRLKDAINELFGGIANNPSKSIIFLVTDYLPRIAQDLTQRANALLGEQVRMKTRDIRGYEIDIIKLTPFVEKTGGEGLGTKPLYFKTWDGFLFGDPFAYLGILSSLIPGAKSGFKIWGTANSSGETTSAETVLLILHKLLQKQVARERDFIKEVFEYKGHAGQEYELFHGRIVRTNLPRLHEAGILKFEHRKRNERVATKLNDGVTYENVNLNSITYYVEWDIPSSYIRRAIEALRGSDGLTNAEIAEKTGIFPTHVRNITHSLRDAGYAIVASGKDYQSFSSIELLDAGHILLHAINPFLEMLGWYDAMAKNGGRVTYSMLGQYVRPDLRALWRYRQENLDRALRTPQGYDSFSRLFGEARKKHLLDKDRTETIIAQN